MALAMAWTGPISAREGLFQAPPLRRRARPRHLPILFEARNNTMTAEETTKAIEVQLRRAKGASGAAEGGDGLTPSQSQPEQSVEDGLQSRQQGARDWIAAWRESQTPTQDSGASTAESQRVLADLRASNPLLTEKQEQAAMERLLNQGTHSVEENGNAEMETSQSPSESSNEGVTQDSEADKYAPKVTFDDGSVMYTAADLEAADYGALLNR